MPTQIQRAALCTVTSHASDLSFVVLLHVTICQSQARLAHLVEDIGAAGAEGGCFVPLGEGEAASAQVDKGPGTASARAGSDEGTDGDLSDSDDEGYPTSELSLLMASPMDREAIGPKAVKEKVGPGCLCRLQG